MKLKPLADRVILKHSRQRKRPRAADPGSIRAGEARDVRGRRSRPGRHGGWQRSEDDRRAGDRVIVGKYSGTTVKVDGEEYSIVRQSDILAVVE